MMNCQNVTESITPCHSMLTSKTGKLTKKVYMNHHRHITNISTGKQ